MTTIMERTEALAADERYEHVRSAFEAQICAEAYKVSQYEGIDSETVADAKSRWDDWAVLYQALNDGLLDELHAKYTPQRTLIRGAS